MANDMQAQRVFSGRIFFDHLPKTAGLAINAWLAAELGSGSISPNLDGNHGDLIRQHGGSFAIIAAHSRFHDREGLDPRYRYLTILRDPIERALSWLYYVVNNHTEQELGAVHGWSRRFLDSEGEHLADGLVPYVSNFYVEHFCRIFGSGLASGQDKLGNALHALQQYDVVGLYPDLERFGADVAALIGVPPPRTIPAVNVTVARPPLGSVPGALIERIAELNLLDRPLYRQALALFSPPAAAPDAPPVWTSAAGQSAVWQLYEAPAARLVATPDLDVVSVTLREGADIKCGTEIHLDVEFCLARPVGELVAGVHILDADGRLAFGTNNVLLGQPWRALAPGSYRVSHRLTAALPQGNYSAGVAFVERVWQGERELAWQDVSCRFALHAGNAPACVGFACLPAAIALSPATPPVPEPAWQPEVLQTPPMQQEQQPRGQGAIVWCTGLSGAGKSTLAQAVAARLEGRGLRTYVLDGDQLRRGLCGDLGFSALHRAENMRRAGEVAKLFLDAGMIVLAAFISPFRADRERLRASFSPGRFLEIYCRCPLEVCERRDVKGLYRRARVGQLPEFTGISSPYEAPPDPELALDTDVLDLDECVARVLALLEQRGLLAAPAPVQ